MSKSSHLAIFSYNLNSKKGWYIPRFDTDQSTPGVTATNFKNKEGKWYQYFSGMPTNSFASSKIIEDFNVQGIGEMIEPSMVFPYDPMVSVSFENDPNDNE